MMSTRVDGKFWIWSASIVAILLGLLTIREGGGYELRTIVAMSLRSTVWIAIAVSTYRFLWRTRRSGGS